MRVPHAARALADDLGQRYKNVKYVPEGDADGLGVARTVRYSGAAGKFLGRVLPQVDDPRIVGVETKGGDTLVTFTHRTIADQRDSFPLDAADTVANAEPQEPAVTDD